MNKSRKGDWVQTYTGKMFWPLDPKEEEIDIIDIAHSLAHLCRFNGHCKEFYSIAQHSIIVSEIVDSPQALAGLLHDASEAYFSDIPGPLKMYLEEIKNLEQKLQEVVFNCFNIKNYDYEMIHRVDKEVLMAEARDLLTPPPEDWGVKYKPISETIIPWNSKTAKRKFLERYYELTKKSF